ncbi:MAG TPA: type II/IV secretion system protein, partial [Rariglobus sp.]
MPLGKIQTQIVGKLVDMGKLSDAQRDALVHHPADLNGDALDKLLTEDYRVTAFQIFVARARAVGIAPFNVSRWRVTAQTYERIPQEFCQEHLVLPVGQVGETLLVAFANPFEVSIPAKIQEMTGMKVARLLGREKDIKEKFSKENQPAAGFEDVVQQIGVEYGLVGDAVEEAAVSEDSGPIIQLSNRIIEDAYYAGTSDIHIEPWEKEIIVRYRIDGVCKEKLRLPAKVGPALVARL